MSDERRTGAITIQTSKLWLILFALVILAPWCLLPAFKLMGTGSHSECQSQLKALEHMRRIPASKGPWGDLQIVRIVTEPPEESLAEYLNYPHPVWVLKDCTTNDFEKLLLSAGLSATQNAEITKATLWDASGTQCSISPTDDFVMHLTPESRAVLYGALSLFQENMFQHEPFRFRADLVDEWFANSGVPESTVALVLRLSYKRGKTLLFSDPHLILPDIPSDIDKVRLLKTLARQSTLMVQLHITKDTDIDSLVSYWAAQADRAKDIKPLLVSLARIPGGFDMDITHLFPRFARKRIYTYPRTDGDKGETTFDCHWNSMNFWNDPPDERFADGTFVIRTLESEYEPVLDSFRMGDVILFMKSNTQAIHSAVYIADNIVFTKNGPSPHSPWILMDMETLISHYETNLDVKIRGYRKKTSAK